MNQKAIDFHRQYSSAMVIYGDATSDYVAGRCCMLNGILFRGHSLSCEAIEKSLKAFYFMQNSKGHSERRHNLQNIKKDLKNAEFLNQYDDLLTFLSDAHKARYTSKESRFPSTKKGTYNANEYLDDIDKLWMDIFDNLPMLDEIKYGLGFFIPALVIKKLNGYRAWLTFENKSLTPRIDELVKKCKETTGLREN